MKRESEGSEKEERTSKGKSVLETFEEVRITGLDKYLCAKGDHHHDHHHENHRGVGNSPQERGLLTFHRTSTVSVQATTTTTTTPAEIETIYFTSVANNAGQCFPNQLVTSLGIGACAWEDNLFLVKVTLFLKVRLAKVCIVPSLSDIYIIISSWWLRYMVMWCLLMCFK